MENFSFFKVVINIEFFKNYSLPRIGKFIDSRSNFERSKPASINPFSKFSKIKLNRIDIFFFFHGEYEKSSMLWWRIRGTGTSSSEKFSVLVPRRDDASRRKLSQDRWCHLRFCLGESSRDHTSHAARNRRRFRIVPPRVTTRFPSCYYRPLRDSPIFANELFIESILLLHDSWD